MKHFFQLIFTVNIFVNTFNVFLIVNLFFMITACSSSTLNSKEKLDGKWKEFYGVEQNSDVAYNDIYIINVNKNIDIINETHPNEMVTEVKFENNELSFKIYVRDLQLPYKLKLMKDDILYGESITINGDKRTVKWKKISE